MNTAIVLLLTGAVTLGVGVEVDSIRIQLGSKSRDIHLGDFHESAKHAPRSTNEVETVVSQVVWLCLALLSSVFHLSHRSTPA